MSDSNEIARIRGKVLRIEEELTVDNNTASFSGDVNVSGNLYVVNDLYVSGSSVTTEQELTSALLPYATSVNVSSSVTGALIPYATSANVSSSVTGVLTAYATSVNVSSSVTASVNTLKGDLTASYARLATANIFTANQTITGTLNASSNISGNANLLIGGNVGIGTSSPSNAVGYTFLTVQNTTNGGIIEAKDSSVSLRMQTYGGGVGVFGTYSNHPLDLVTNSTSKVRITEAGNVGLDIFPPTTKLDVNGAITLRGNRIYHNTSSYVTEFGPGAGTGDLNFYGFYTPSGKATAIYANAGNSSVVLSGTNVGIGTLSPRNNLEVGNNTSNQTIRVGGIYSGPTSGYTGVDQETTRHQLVFSSWRDAQTDTIGAKITAINKTAYVSPNWYLVQNTDIAFSTLSTTPTNTDSTTEKMRLLSNGDLLVGFTSDQGVYKLQVNGDIYTPNNVVLTNTGGITFGTTAGGSGTRSSNTLSDYEQGTWTPYFYQSGGTGNYTYQVQNGRYTKVGNICHIVGALRLNNVSLPATNGNLLIGGLPFSHSSTYFTSISIGYYLAFNSTLTSFPSGYIESSNTFINLTKIGTGGYNVLTNGDLTTTSYILFTATYATT